MRVFGQGVTEGGEGGECGCGCDGGVETVGGAGGGGGGGEVVG